MSSPLVLKQETKAREKPQPTDAEQALSPTLNDPGTDESLILVLYKMAGYALEENRIRNEYVLAGYALEEDTISHEDETAKHVLEETPPDDFEEEDVIPDNGDCKQMSLFETEDISGSRIEGRGKGKRKMNKPKHKISENPTKDAIVQLMMFD